MILMCGEMLGMSQEGEPYGLSGEETKRFWDALKRADLVLDIMHNRFPYPAQDAKRVRAGWSAHGAVFMQANNRQPSGTTPHYENNPAVKGLPADQIYNPKKIAVGTKVYRKDVSSETEKKKLWRIQKIETVKKQKGVRKNGKIFEEIMSRSSFV